jgi:hypothetical protein
MLVGRSENRRASAFMDAVQPIFHSWPAEISWSAENMCPVHLIEHVHRHRRADLMQESLAEPPHVALLLSGMLGNSRGRASSDGGDVIFGLHPRVWNSTAVHIVDALQKSDNATVLTFVCIGPKDVLSTHPAEEATIRERLRVAVLHRSEAFGDRASSWGAARDELSWARLRDCFETALTFENPPNHHHHHQNSTSRRRPFTHFIRGRPDMVWYWDVPPLHASAHMVAVRAWLLHLGGTKKLGGFVSRDHLVGPHGCMSRLFAKQRLVTTQITNSTNATQGISRSRSLYLPCLSLRKPCLIADDQVAVVPRAWSLEYFSHCRSGAAPSPIPPIPMDDRSTLAEESDTLTALHPGLRAEIVQELEAKSTLAPHWGAAGSPPVDAIFRRWGDPSECEACMACNSSTHMQNTRCAEPRLTARLLALGVPLGVAAFRQRLLPSLTPGQADPLDSGVLVDRWLVQGEAAFDLWNGYPSHYAWSC